MLEIEEAQARVLGAIDPLPGERVRVQDAHQRVLFEAIAVPLSLPPFDNSAMDGYALRAADTAKASAITPVKLKCIGAVPAGSVFEHIVETGTCVRLFTGAPLPRGADAVVMQEDTRVTGDDVAVLEATKPWENVRFAGEDMKRGEIAVRAGERLTAGRLALLAAMGIGEVQVGARPLIGILGTGSELLEAGEPMAPGKIYESNRAMIAPLVHDAGGNPQILPLVRDSFEATREALEKAFAGAHAVITTGGVSVGDYDLVKAAFEALGGTVDFWQVALKPGKPFVFGKLGPRFLFGLPGNPVSAFVAFLLLVRPAILKMQGARDWSLPVVAGVLAEPLHNHGARRHYMRVRVDETGKVWSAGLQASHVLGALAQANGLVSVAPKTQLDAGALVKVYVL